MKVIHQLHMGQISFQEFHDIKRAIPCFKASSSTISVITNLINYHQVILSLSNVVNFLRTDGIQNSLSSFRLCFEVLQKSVLSDISPYRANIRFVSMCLILPVSEWFLWTGFLSDLNSHDRSGFFSFVLRANLRQPSTDCELGGGSWEMTSA